MEKMRGVQALRLSDILAARHLVLATVLAALLTGCGPGGAGDLPRPDACTEIGCNNTLEFNFSTDLQAGAAYRVEACVDAECSAQTLQAGSCEGCAPMDMAGDLTLDAEADRLSLRLPDREFSGEHPVSLSVVDADGMVIAATETETSFSRSQPNGPGCPPICWFTSIVV